MFAKRITEIFGLRLYDTDRQLQPRKFRAAFRRRQRHTDPHSAFGLEKMLASAIVAALQPFQAQFEKMQSAIVQLQEDTQCSYSDLDDSDMETSEEKANSAAAPAVSAQKKPRLSKADKVRSKIAK